MSIVSKHIEKPLKDGTAESSDANPEKSVPHAAHPDFEKVQASRPDWHQDSRFHLTKTPNPIWKLGHGANDGGESLTRTHIEINPYAEGRPSSFNYKLLISGIVPRPIAFLSTRSRDGEPKSPPSPLAICDTQSSRHFDQLGAVFVLQCHKPRPPLVYHRHFWLARSCQGQSAQSLGHARMHHQHYLGALSRSSQRHGDQRSLRGLRVASVWADTGAMHIRFMRPRQRSHIQHRGHLG